MAQFIPNNPHSKNSQAENKVLKLLEKLSDNWFVFHSVGWLAPNNYKKATQGEIDVVVFHIEKGMLVLEIKGGQISAEKLSYYSTDANGKKHAIQNPMQQAADNKHAFRLHLKDKLDGILDSNGEKKFANLINKVIIGHAVWFPDCKMPPNITYPHDWKPQYTLTFDAIYDPESALTVALEMWREQLSAKFFQQQSNGTSNFGEKLTEEEAMAIIKATAPEFAAIPVHAVDAKIREMRFIRLTENQNRILDYIHDDVEYIAIYGSAGTGKTLLAAELCKRFSLNQEKVLFLCYNKLLKERVEEYKKVLCPEFHQYWDVMNFDGLALSLLKESPPGFSAGWDALKKKLVEYLKNGEYFPYRNVVVDEAQDFKDEWLRILKKRAPGKFVVFYDPMQLVYGEDGDLLPSFFDQADVKLKLPYNLRNTVEIARTGYGFAKIQSKCLVEISGPKPKFFIYDNEESRVEYIRKVLDTWRQKYPPREVMIGFLGKKPPNYQTQIYKFSDGVAPIMDTVLRLKGLEASAVLLPEADFSKLISKKQRNKLYVATTRPRHELVVCARNPNPNVLKFISEYYEIDFARDAKQFIRFFEADVITNNGQEND